MKRIGRTLLIVAANLVVIIALADIWQSRPDLFPRIPEDVAIRLVTWYGAKNADEVEDLEIILALAVSATIVCMLSLSGRLVWKAFKRR